MYAEAAPPAIIRSLIYDGLKHKLKLTEMSRDGGKTIYLPWLRMIVAPYAWDQDHYAINFMTYEGQLIPAIVGDIAQIRIVKAGLEVSMKNSVVRLFAPHISGGYEINLS